MIKVYTVCYSSSNILTQSGSKKNLLSIVGNYVECVKVGQKPCYEQAQNDMYLGISHMLHYVIIPMYVKCTFLSHNPSEGSFRFKVY